jgi:Tannase-like family of unknown function (DUF6351)
MTGFSLMMLTPPRGLAATLIALVAVLALAAPAAAKSPKPKLSVLSSKPDMVSGGDALVAVDVPKGSKAAKVRVRRNGRNVTGSFSASDSSPRRLVGLVGGLAEGPNNLTAIVGGSSRAAALTLFNSATAGPLFSGPHQSPFICTTESNGLGPATDADCSAPTKIVFRYRSTDGDFKPLADPTQRPADLAQTTTRDGEIVDYVVRVESGVINRAVYRWAVLAPGGVVGAGWNDRLIYSFGGGCGAGYQQGNSGVGTVLDNRQLSRGYSVMSSSLTVLGTACNDVLSAETVSMVKEHVIESLGRAPAWTIGEGGSGGSVQAQMIGQNYPGLLDGLLPSASFPDSSAPDYPDCRLLNGYYETADGSSLSNAQRNAISGLANPNGCLALGAGADVVNATEGCDESVVPATLIFDPVSNPAGARCTVWDSMVNVYGRDSSTGYARRALDNTGVQYGLAALQQGDLTPGEFLDLNEQIGGYDDDGFVVNRRSVADDGALAVAYQTGRVNQAAGGIPTVPIIDARVYVDDEVNVHQYFNTYRFRARLLRRNGTDANQVMFRASGGQNTTPMLDTALDLMGQWLDAIAADKSNRSEAEKVIADKPDNAVDACWANGGQRTNGPAVIGDGNFCENTYPPHSLPSNQAGRPVDSLVLKCQLRPIDYGDYPALNNAQRSRLSAIFPDGVCDWSKPGVGEQRFNGTWQSFGPSHRVKARKRELKLRASPRHPGPGKRTTLNARLRPCPRTTWQRITFEQHRRGKWRTLDRKVARGSRCRARLRLRVKRPLEVRASARSLSGFAGAHSKRFRISARG